MFEIQNQLIYDSFYKEKPYHLEALTYLSLYFQKHTSFPSSIIEVGAGTGRLATEILKTLPKLNYLAVEPNPQFSQYLGLISNNYTNFTSFTGFYEQLPWEMSSVGQFNLVILNFNVVNYFSPEKLLNFLKSISTMSSSDGLCIIFDTWSYERLSLNPPVATSSRETINLGCTFTRDAVSCFDQNAHTISIAFKFWEKYINSEKSFIGEEIHNLHIFPLESIESMLSFSGFSSPMFYSFDNSILKSLHNPSESKNILCVAHLFKE